MTYPSPLALFIDMAKSLDHARRENMSAGDNAIFDMMLMLELHKRGAVKDLHLEMRLLADRHLRTSPYVAGIMKAIATHIDPKNNIVTFNKPQPPGGNPCP